MRGAPIKGTCEGNHDTVEKCFQPKLPVCKDRNKYCSLPPEVDKLRDRHLIKYIYNFAMKISDF